MRTVEALKSIFNSFPWPHHVEICQARYDELRAGLPTKEKQPVGPIGLDIFISDEVPLDEVHLKRWSRADGRFQTYAVLKIEA